jgi:hypothetical protein
MLFCFILLLFIGASAVFRIPDCLLYENEPCAILAHVNRFQLDVEYRAGGISAYFAFLLHGFLFEYTRLPAIFEVCASPLGFKTIANTASFTTSFTASFTASLMNQW